MISIIRIECGMADGIDTSIDALINTLNSAKSKADEWMPERIYSSNGLGLIGISQLRLQQAIVLILLVPRHFLAKLATETVELLNHIITYEDEKVRFLIDFLKDLVSKIDALCSDQTKHLPLFSFLSDGSISEDFNKQAGDVKNLLNACQKILMSPGKINTGSDY